MQQVPKLNEFGGISLDELMVVSARQEQTKDKQKHQEKRVLGSADFAQRLNRRDTDIFDLFFIPLGGSISDSLVRKLCFTK